MGGCEDSRGGVRRDWGGFRVVWDSRNGEAL